MRKKLNITEGIFPMPVLMVATYNEDGSVNVMNAAFGNRLSVRFLCSTKTEMIGRKGRNIKGI